MVNHWGGEWSKVNTLNCHAKKSTTLLIKRLNKSGQCWLKNFHNGEEYTLTTSLDKGSYFDLVRFKKSRFL